MSTGDPFKVTPEFIEQTFRQRVEPMVFSDAVTPSTRQPLLVLLGGQPGAGKSQAQESIVAAHPQAALVEVTGDDFRQFHPDFRRLVHEEPLRMPEVTAAVSGPMVRRCLDHAKEHCYSVLLEGTFRSVEQTTATVAEFAAAGYRIEVVAVVPHPAVCMLSAEHRYLSADMPYRARWTPPEAHRVTIANIPAVIDALETHTGVARIEIRTRTDSIYTNERDEHGAWPRQPRARASLADQWRAPWSDTFAQSWLADYGRLRTVAETRTGYLDAAAPTWRALDEVADRATTGQAVAHGVHPNRLIELTSLPATTRQSHGGRPSRGSNLPGPWRGPAGPAFQS